MNQQSPTEELPATYFREELGRFRDLCGDKRFWNSSGEKRDAAFKGITVLYLSTPGLTDADVLGYRMAMENYSRRAAYFGKIA